MTEQEWAECTDPYPMLKFLKGKASDRKLRLFAVACCRQIWHLIKDRDSRLAVEIAEQYADGEASEGERAGAEYHVVASYSSADAAAFSSITREGRPAIGASIGALGAVAAAKRSKQLWGNAGKAPVREVRAQLTFLCDIFGNPFRLVVLDPTWRTPIVTALATAAYEERQLPAGTLDPQRLAILADALEDAGCTDATILDHCRSSGPHVRGCWVVDLVLAKS